MNKKVATAAALLLTFAKMSAAEGIDAAEWNFDVYLNDREIGFHTFDLDEVGDMRVLRSEAEFKVKILFVTAFTYEHNNKEVWRDGCLRSIEATTNSNGKQFSVTGEMDGSQFLLDSEQGPSAVDDCVATFAYWDRQLLERRRLLNSQTGEYLEVDFERKPNSPYRLGEREIEAERIHVTAKGVDIVLTYAARSGEWLALDSKLKNGRTLSYRRSADDLQSTRLAELNQ